MSDDSTRFDSEIIQIRRDISDIKVQSAHTQSELQGIKHTLVELKSDLRQEFVTQDTFSPVQKIVYGAIGIIATAFILAIVSHTSGELNVPGKAVEMHEQP